MGMTIKDELQRQRKEALLTKNKEKSSIIGMIAAEIKQFEVDNQVEVNEESILNILDKMVKQRRDALSQFESAGRDDIVAQTKFEIDVIQTFLPAQLTESELDTIIDHTVSSLNISSIKEMAKLMEHLRPQVKGRADMRLVSEKIKQKLNSI